MQVPTHSGPASHTRVLVALLAVASAVLYWAGNAQTPLWDRDEPRFAEAAREMLATGDFVVPRFHNEVRYDKPILGYYPIVAGMKLFGVGEFGARAASGLFGVLCVILLFSLARRMTGSDRTALAAAAVLATAPIMCAEAKLATVDAGLLFWLLLTFTCLWRIYEAPCPRRWAVLFWAALALAVLTKGPVALAAVFVPVILMALFSRERTFLKRIGWLYGVPLFVVVCLPWAIAVQAKTGGDFLRVALGKHVIERSTGALEGHSGFPGFYLATIFATFFPWSFFVPGAVWASAKSLRDRPREIFLVSWAAGLIIVLEIVKTKMVHYALPVFPALAIIVALFFERALVEKRRLAALGAACACVFALALAVGLTLAVRNVGLDAAVVPLAAAGAVLVAGLIAAAVGIRKGRYLAVAFAAVYAWLFVVSAFGLPALGSYGATRSIAEIVQRPYGARILDNPESAPPLLVYGYEEPSLVFETHGRASFPSSAEKITRNGVSGPPSTVVVSRRPGPARDFFDALYALPAATVTGYNFAKGRWETLDVYRLPPDNPAAGIGDPSQ